MRHSFSIHWAWLALLIFASWADAQRPDRGGLARGDAVRGGSPVRVGTMLPAVTVFDEQGKPFSTARLRGSYTVVVFGCLT